MTRQSVVFAAIAATFVVAGPLDPAFAQDATEGGATADRRLSVGLGGPESIRGLRSAVGVAGRVAPDYEGSDDFGLAALPLVDVRHRYFFVEGTGVDINDGLASAGLSALHVAYSDPSAGETWMQLGPLVRYRGGRDEQANDALDDLGDVDPSIEAGGFLEAVAGPWSVRATLAQDVGGGHEGFLTTFGARYTAKLGDLTLSVGPSASWASEDYMQSYFGVTDKQASRSRHAPFDAEAGFKDVGAALRASYAITPHWLVEGQVGYWRLLGDAADSPLVDDEGSAGQFRALFGVAYRF